MPRRPDHHLAYWNMAMPGLGAYPESIKSKKKSKSIAAGLLENVGLSGSPSVADVPAELQPYVSPFQDSLTPTTSDGRVLAVVTGTKPFREGGDVRLPAIVLQQLLGAPPGAVVDTRDILLGKTRFTESQSPIGFTIVLRDRLGFRYERRVGLKAFIGQSDAAQLLGIPVMRVNRLVRAGVLPAKKRRVAGGKQGNSGGRNYSVIKVADVLRLAKALKLAVPIGKALTVVRPGANTSERKRPQKEKG